MILKLIHFYTFERISVEESGIGIKVNELINSLFNKNWKQRIIPLSFDFANTICNDDEMNCTFSCLMLCFCWKRIYFHWRIIHRILLEKK